MNRLASLPDSEAKTSREFTRMRFSTTIVGSIPAQSLPTRIVSVHGSKMGAESGCELELFFFAPVDARFLLGSALVWV